MNDLIKELSTLTTIAPKHLTKLLDKVYYCINDCVEENLVINDEEVVDIDIAIGTLSIKVDGGRILYKFKPSEKLENTVKDTIINRKNLLTDTDAIEINTVNKITDMYKDFI